MTYTIPNIPNGDYEVTLHWAEVYASSIGQRVFDVAVQEEVAIEDLDIFAAAGFDTALSLSTAATVVNEEISISFLRKVENPKINAIELRLLPSEFLGTESLELGTTTSTDASDLTTHCTDFQRLSLLLPRPMRPVRQAQKWSTTTDGSKPQLLRLRT